MAWERFRVVSPYCTIKQVAAVINNFIFKCLVCVFLMNQVKAFGVQYDQLT